MGLAWAEGVGGVHRRSARAAQPEPPPPPAPHPRPTPSTHRACRARARTSPAPAAGTDATSMWRSPGAHAADARAARPTSVRRAQDAARNSWGRVGGRGRGVGQAGGPGPACFAHRPPSCPAHSSRPVAPALPTPAGRRSGRPEPPGRRPSGRRTRRRRATPGATRPTARARRRPRPPRPRTGRQTAGPGTAAGNRGRGACGVGVWRAWAAAAATRGARALLAPLPNPTASRHPPPSPRLLPQGGHQGVVDAGDAVQGQVGQGGQGGLPRGQHGPSGPSARVGCLGVPGAGGQCGPQGLNGQAPAVRQVQGAGRVGAGLGRGRRVSERGRSDRHTAAAATLCCTLLGTGCSAVPARSTASCRSTARSLAHTHSLTIARRRR